MKTTRIMNKIIIYLSAVLLLCSCGSARHYAAFQYDNGDGNGKRWQAPAASTGIGKVMTGTTLTNKGTGVRIKIQTRTKHIHNTAITPEVQMRAFGVSL